jgi:hypothetical protein
VRVFLAAEEIRKRAELAKLFGELLTSVPEWRDLLGGTGIDPIQHFDNVLISGPQLRKPRWIVVAADYNVGSERMKNAVDAVVKKSGPAGKWHPEYDMPVASIGAKAERRVVLLVDKRLMYILPDNAEGQIDKLKGAKPFGKSDVAISIFVITPWRAVKGVGIKFPESIAWMKLNLVLTPDGGFQVMVEGKDATADEAERHAKELEKQIEAVRVIPLPFIRDIEHIGKPTWTVEGDIIRATAPVSAAQVRKILLIIKDVVLPPLIDKARKKKAAAANKKKAAAAASAKAASKGSQLNLRKATQRERKGRRIDAPALSPSGKGANSSNP